VATKTKTKKPRKGPSPDPQRILSTVWYYEEPRRLEFVVECRAPDDTRYQTITFNVPLAMIRKSLARIDGK